MLEAGGNAFDAAVAAGFTLQVAEPHLNGPGGDLPLIFAGPDREPTVLCGQGPAPAGATDRPLPRPRPGPDPRLGPARRGGPGQRRPPGSRCCATTARPPARGARAGDPLRHAPASRCCRRSRRRSTRVADLFRDQWPTSAEVYLGARRVAAQPGLGRHAAAARRRGRGRQRRPRGADPARARLVAARLRRRRDRRVRPHAAVGLLRRARTPACSPRHDMADWTPDYEPPVDLRLRAG